MSKIRVYELAKDLGMDNKELIERMEKLGIAVRSHSSTLEEEDVDRIRQEFALGERNTVVEQRVATGVIRRRSVRRQAERSQPEEATPETAESEETEETVEELPVSETPEREEEPGPREETITVSTKLPRQAPAKIVGFVKGARKDTGSEQTAEQKSDARKGASASGTPSEPTAGEGKKPGAETTAEADHKGKQKKKKTVDVSTEEKAPRKKALFKQKGEKKAKNVLWESEPQRETRKVHKVEKKVAPAVMKKTEITTPKAIKRRIRIEDAIRVGDLAKKMGVKASDLMSKLISLGMMVTINQSIDSDAAAIVAAEFGYQVEAVGVETEEIMPRKEGAPEDLRTRAPVVTVMGHVDHGKTSLLDAIRQTNVIDGEAGGITQAIGAHHVRIKNREIVFLDTPGHEAFTSMRARGAQVTDIVVLVVAADDGVMDQTVEAINHARAAGVPIIVAVNKIDKNGADPDRITQQLSEYELIPEDWGGDTIYVRVSAKQKEGIEELLELILLQADMMELKADPTGAAQGVIIESKLDKGRGPVATVLIQQGTLRDGDAFVSKAEYGKVRAMIDDTGNRLEDAGPARAVEVVGFSSVPQAGTTITVVEDERRARAIADHRMQKTREKELSQTSKITLEQLYERIKEGVKELNVILKADVQGSIEALRESLEKLSTDDVKVAIIHSSTGAVTETDVMLASASNAVIIGFMVRPDMRVSDLAANEGVEIKYYDVIYNAIADVRAAMEGLLEPVYEEVYEGRAVVREVFKVPRIGAVAGCYITDGKVSRTSNLRLIRDGVVVHDGTILSLKRFKDDAKEVAQGFECGIGIDGFNDIKVDDVIETYTTKQVERTLES